MFLKNRLVSVAFFLCILPSYLSAQDYSLGFSIQPKFGFLISHRVAMEHLVQEHAYGIGSSFVLLTNGNTQWHQDLNFPEINGSLNYLSLGNSSVLGSAFELEAGIYLPFFRKNGWSLGPKFNLGLAFVTKRYDVVTNPKNNAIGSYFNAAINIGVKMEKQFGQQALGFNLSLHHLSNGAIRLPNLGLNVPLIGLNYTCYFTPLKERTPLQDNEVVDRVESPWGIYSQFVLSTKQVYPTGGRNYGVVSLTPFVNYKLNKRFVLESGLDFIYNQSIIKSVGGNWSRAKNFQIGIYGAYVLPIQRFYLLLGMGRYVLNPLNPNGMFYHRLGIRFQATDKLLGALSIKSNWGKADYFEFGLIYKW